MARTGSGLLGDTRKIKTDGLVNIQKAGWADSTVCQAGGRRQALPWGKTPWTGEGPRADLPHVSSCPVQHHSQANCNKMIMMSTDGGETACRTSLRSTTGPTDSWVRLSPWQELP